MGNPYDRDVCWDATDSVLVGVFYPEFVRWLRRVVVDKREAVAWRLREHANGILSDLDGWGALRKVVQDRASHRYGADVDGTAPNVELDMLLAMRTDYEHILSVFPVVGGVVQCTELAHTEAVRGLLLDLNISYIMIMERHQAELSRGESTAEAVERARWFADWSYHAAMGLMAACDRHQAEAAEDSAEVY